MSDSDSFLTKWERIIKDMPIDGYVMEPRCPWESEAASIICGHDLIQRLSDDDQAIFELFVREVLRTTAVTSQGGGK